MYKNEAHRYGGRDILAGAGGFGAGLAAGSKMVQSGASWSTGLKREKIKAVDFDLSSILSGTAEGKGGAHFYPIGSKIKPSQISDMTLRNKFHYESLAANPQDLKFMASKGLSHQSKTRLGRIKRKSGMGIMALGLAAPAIGAWAGARASAAYKPENRTLLHRLKINDSEYSKIQGLKNSGIEKKAAGKVEKPILSFEDMQLFYKKDNGPGGGSRYANPYQVKTKTDKRIGLGISTASNLGTAGYVVKALMNDRHNRAAANVAENIKRGVQGIKAMPYKRNLSKYTPLVLGASIASEIAIPHIQQMVNPDKNRGLLHKRTVDKAGLRQLYKTLEN